MPLVLILAVLVLAIMYYRYRTSGLTRDCRWRRAGPDGTYVCAFCGARTRVKDGSAPNRCLRSRG